LAGWGEGRTGNFTAAAAMADGGAVCACGEARAAFYRRASAWGGVRALPRCPGRRIKGRCAAAKAHRASPAGNTSGGPAGASAGGHTRV
jgi:hypothetical protein